MNVHCPPEWPHLPLSSTCRKEKLGLETFYHSVALGSHTSWVTDQPVLTLSRGTLVAP